MTLAASRPRGGCVKHRTMRAGNAVAGGLGTIAVLALAMTAACGEKKAPPSLARIDKVKDALVSDDASKIAEATAGLPACPKAADAAACLTAMANDLGSKKGFVREPADQAACATVAVVLTRDKRGSAFGDSAAWGLQLKSGKGPGVDALRLAVARAMAASAPAVGRAFDDEKDFPILLRSVAESVPGACDTYAALGEGADPKKLPPETSAEHSACVHKHLSLRGGPGPSYGDGLPRAAEGAAALWRDTEKNLRLGLAAMSGPARDQVEAKLKVVEAATLKLTLKKIENAATPTQVVNTLLDVHEDAGIYIGHKDGGAPEAGPRPLKKGL